MAKDKSARPEGSIAESSGQPELDVDELMKVVEEHQDISTPTPVEPPGGSTGSGNPEVDPERRIRPTETSEPKKPKSN